MKRSSDALTIKTPKRAQTPEESAWVTGDQKHARQWAPVKTLKQERVAIWLFIFAVIIISLLGGYLLWAKLSSRSLSESKLRTFKIPS